MMISALFLFFPYGNFASILHIYDIINKKG